MTQNLDSRVLGLSTRTVVEHVAEDTLAILIKRRSRIVMADGVKILDKATKIKTVMPDMNVVLKTNAPVCSKTIQLFENNGLTVIKV